MAVIDSGKAPTPISPNPKKAKLDRNSVKQILDQTVIEILNSKGYVEKYKETTSKLVKGTFCLAMALFAPYLVQLYFGRNLNLICLYVFWSLKAGRNLSGYFKEMNVFLFTYPLKGYPTGLAFSSKLEKSSDLYTLTIDCEDLKSARPPVNLTGSFYKWFASDGVIIEGLFRKDVEGLLNQYAEECNEINRSWFWRIADMELIFTFSLLGLCMMIYL